MDVKWIKIVTDIFDDEKILLIESMPESDSIIVVWFKLLCMAGKQNNGGVLMMNDKIAYTDEMLATIFRRPLNTVRLALKTFEQFGMIEIVNDAITIPNWEKHQSLDKLEKAKEQNRKRVAAHREKQKLIATADSENKCNDYSNVTVMESNATDKIRIEEDKIRIEKDISCKKSNKKSNLKIEEIILYLNEKAGTSYRANSKTTQQHINARLSEGYTVEDFKTVIDKKCADWLGTEWEQYLRPTTLFGTKFENYLNQKTVHKQNVGVNGIAIQEKPNSEKSETDLAFERMLGG